MPICHSDYKYHMLVVGNHYTLSNASLSKLDDCGTKVIIKSPQALSARDPHQLALYDIIFIDYDLQIGELLFNLQKLNSIATNRPVLVLTSTYRTSTLALAFKLGFDEFIAKPLRAEEMMALLKKKQK